MFFFFKLLLDILLCKNFKSIEGYKFCALCTLNLYNFCQEAYMFILRCRYHGSLDEKMIPRKVKFKVRTVGTVRPCNHGRQQVKEASI